MLERLLNPYTVLPRVNVIVLRIQFLVAEDMSEGLHILSHDPSLALYRLQEHVKKSLLTMVEKRVGI